MRRKGISPLIAAVLLIAFTLAVAALLTAWVTTFTQDTTEAVGDESERLIDCSYAGIRIIAASWGGGNTATIAIENTGTTELGNITVAALEGGSVIGSNTYDGSQTPTPGAVQGFSLTLDQSTLPDQMRVSSTACPEISDQTTSITDNS